ncbi:hypothetical protein F0L17_14655 [Streptomyces sp. TRM43335]|uniref:Uncharacterized protein n=1 Tax=Streptomyces taklimakanensis TaxID=2569853 RepID=A0A6G2BDW9_9ACTN|nr:hypothetical protein [Streptomyces taklimakanensis]MTE20326.1 hypothetical protein [Streptomyces taklimakanensis]
MTPAKPLPERLAAEEIPDGTFGGPRPTRTGPWPFTPTSPAHAAANLADLAAALTNPKPDTEGRLMQPALTTPAPTPQPPTTPATEEAAA